MPTASFSLAQRSKQFPLPTPQPPPPPPLSSSAEQNGRAFHDAVRAILPPNSPILHLMSARLYRVMHASPDALLARSQALDEAWALLTDAGITPRSYDLDQLYMCLVRIHDCASNAKRPRSSAAQLQRARDNFASWNNDSATIFDEIVLSAGVGVRVTTQRNDQQHSFADEQKPSATPSSAPAAASSSFSPAWLRARCSRLAIIEPDGGISDAEMALSVLTLLTDSSKSDDQLQGLLFDAFAGDFDAVGDVLSHRVQIVAIADAVMADCTQATELAASGIHFDPSTTTATSRNSRGVKARSRNRGRRDVPLAPGIIVRDAREEALLKEQRRQRQLLIRSGVLPAEDQSDFDEDDAPTSAPQLGGSSYQERQRAFPGVEMDRDSVIGSVDRVTLPKGSTREVGRGYEQIFVPPPSRDSASEVPLVEISVALAEHPELLTAMKGVTRLNRLQSAVYPMAFNSDENLLVCAPTGAGKTNVALLTIFREIVAVKTRMQSAFKVVYVAPMKALAAEVTEKFGSRLAPLGLRVREYTGDMSLSRLEALQTHVLVTTPEKWDVVTRKSGSDLGDAVTLFIVDEIHLLHDERGAVLESIVARTLRLSETAQKQIRLVGLSATLPNYRDVGSFMKVDPNKGLFHFDGSHRPVPLSQTFIGISEGGTSNSNEARRRREGKTHEMAWRKVRDSLQRGHQAMIFVHSRKGTSTAAREMLSRATLDNVADLFLGGDGKSGKKPSGGGGGKSVKRNNSEEDGPSVALPTWAAKEVSKSKTADIRELCSRGIGIHNAGLPRPDRKLVEKLFAEGVIKLLCCTATLAWGVNLPARTVVIMGTEVYDAQKGGFVQLGMLDVMQIFGRAGRPQFDTEGEGTIITMHEHLGKYLSLLTSSIPIESKLGASASRLADHLNAEIVSGTVSSIGEGVRWLSYTYLSVRMPQNPLVYGIDWEEVHADSGLHSRRATLIEQAAKALDDARMCRYDPRTGTLAPTDLGRVSSHFYVSHETIVLWNEQLGNLNLKPAASDLDWEEVYSIVLHAVSCATEFEQMRSRQEEADELENLVRLACPIPLKSGSETREGKVSILLQAYISRATIRLSDLSYVVQSATRLLRSLFEITLRRGMPSLSLASLELARASESQIWPFQHPLWQFTYMARRTGGLLIHPETIALIEENDEKSSVESLRSMSRDELGVIIRAPKTASMVQRILKAIPTLEVESARVCALNRTVLSVEVRLFPNFRWNDVLHGHAESWWIWIEDKEDYRVYYSQRILLTKRQVSAMSAETSDNSSDTKQTVDFTFIVPVFDPPSSHYWIRIESEQWHTGGSTTMLSVADVGLPQEKEFMSELGDAIPITVASLPGKEGRLFGNRMSYLNPLQSRLYDFARNSNENMLLSAPSGSGKWVIGELAILRCIEELPEKMAVYIAPTSAILRFRSKAWSDNLFVLVNGKLKVLDDISDGENESCLKGIQVLMTTAEKWNKFTQNWSVDETCSRVGLFVFDELHLMSSLEYNSLEICITRLRYSLKGAGPKQRAFPRIVAMSGMLPNAAELGDWLGVVRTRGMFSFNRNVVQVPCESHVIGVAGDRYTSRMQSMNRPLFSMIQRYSARKPVVIFVSSRRQTLLTAQDLIRLAALDGKQGTFKGSAVQPNSDTARAMRRVYDAGLRRALTQGICLYHSGLNETDRGAAELLFRKGHMQVMICTFDMARTIDVATHLVIIKGTERYDVSKQRYEDVDISEILHMIGLAGRVGEDSSCYAVLFAHEPKKTLFKKFLHEALPVESGILPELPNILMNEMRSSGIVSLHDATQFVENTFLFSRLHQNPGYYGLLQSSSNLSRRESKKKTAASAVHFVKDYVRKALQSLRDSERKDTSKDNNFELSKQ